MGVMSLVWRDWTRADVKWMYPQKPITYRKARVIAFFSGFTLFI
jgi:hypothetical protein